jgi:hypothetical protein
MFDDAHHTHDGHPRRFGKERKPFILGALDLLFANSWDPPNALIELCGFFIFSPPRRSPV